MTSLILGKKVQDYPDTYTPSLLYKIPRSTQRAHLNLDINALPFSGIDRWNDYEFSWLDKKTGWPQTYVLGLEIPCTSSHLIESKSLKLYLGSFTHSLFDEQEVLDRLHQDLHEALGAPVKLELISLSDARMKVIDQNKNFNGVILDDLNISCQKYEYNPSLLEIETPYPTKQNMLIRSFRSRCLITQQPDWAYVMIEYQGPQLNLESVFQYLVSFRGHCEFHEHCIERIYTDLHNLSSPSYLKVKGFFSRRGSLDINPMRSHDGVDLEWNRQFFQ